jgi:hypothetical protein
MTDTTYIVLRLQAGVGEQETSWGVVSKVENVKSANAALRAAVNTADTKNPSGTYVAVPARSWKPVTVSIETQTVIRLDTPAAES